MNSVALIMLFRKTTRNAENQRIYVWFFDCLKMYRTLEDGAPRAVNSSRRVVFCRFLVCLSKTIKIISFTFFFIHTSVPG